MTAKSRTARTIPRKRSPIASLPAGVWAGWATNGHGGESIMVRLGKKFTGREKRIERRFANREEALTWIHGPEASEFRGTTQGGIVALRKDAGAEAFKLSPAQISAAVAAYKRLGTHSLDAAVSYYLRHAVPDRGVLAWEAAVDRWVASPARTGRPRDPKTEKTMRQSAGMLAASVPKGILPHQVTSEHVLDFLEDDDWEPATERHHLINLRAFFRWLVGAAHSGSDPTAKIPTPSYDKEVVVLSPIEAAKLISMAPENMLVPIALGLFAGLRSSEIQGLCWSDIGEVELQVLAAKAKTRKHRMVPILPSLQAWLDLYAGSREGKVAPENWRDSFRRLTHSAGWFAIEKDEFGKEVIRSTWPRNAMRHSYGTYRLAASKNEGYVAVEMGNTPDVIVRYYRRVIPSAPVVKYWSILPARPKNLIAITK